MFALTVVEFNLLKKPTISSDDNAIEHFSEIPSHLAIKNTFCIAS